MQCAEYHYGLQRTRLFSDSLLKHDFYYRPGITVIVITGIDLTIEFYDNYYWNINR